MAAGAAAARASLLSLARVATEDMRIGTVSTLGALWEAPSAPPLALVFLRRLG